jgi:hypothetical protein
MAIVKRLVLAERRIVPDGEFSSHTGTIHVKEWESEDRSFRHLHIFATTPTTSHFNSFNDGTVVPNGTLLTNIAASGLTYIKTGATTWVELGDLT